MNSKNTTDLKKQILRLDSIRAIKKAMLEAGIDIGNREIHINYLLDDLEQLISNREKLARIELAEAYSAMGRDDMSWGANGVPKEVLKVVPESYKTSTADVPRGKNAFMDFMLTTLRKELDREEPTHE